MTFFLFDFKYMIFEKFENILDMLPFLYGRDVIIDIKGGRLYGNLQSEEGGVITYKTNGGYIEKVAIADLIDIRLKPEEKEVHRWMQNRRKIE